jgi:hypothetical protein
VVEAVAFDRVGHLVRVPVVAGDKACRFLLDSGNGLSTVASELAEHLGLRLTGTSFTGQRMSGQEITAPLAHLPRLTIGGHVIENAVVGVFDLGPTAGESGFDGIVGLDLLHDVVVRVDPSTRSLLLQPDLPLVSGDIEIPVRVHRDGPSVTLFAGLRLPSGRAAEVEIDTGSGCLILDSGFMADCGVGAEDITETLAGTDETGHRYSRSFAATRGVVSFVDAPAAGQQDPRTMFQSIVHDGLLGSEFLDRFVHSFDVRDGRLVLSAFRTVPSGAARE